MDFNKKNICLCRDGENIKMVFWSTEHLSIFDPLNTTFLNESATDLLNPLSKQVFTYTEHKLYHHLYCCQTCQMVQLNVELNLGIFTISSYYTSPFFHSASLLSTSGKKDSNNQWRQRKVVKNHEKKICQWWGSNLPHPNPQSHILTIGPRGIPNTIFPFQFSSQQK